MVGQINVNAIIFGSTHLKLTDDFKTLKKTTSEMSSMGPFYFFLGLNIKKSKEWIFINQEAFTKTSLTKFRINGDSKFKTLMAFRKNLTPLLIKATNDITFYRIMIGSLLYLISSRLDIMFAVCCCARYQ